MQIHKTATDIVLKNQKDVGNLLSHQNMLQKAINRVFLSKILQNIIFLARQGLPMRGNWVNDEVYGGCERESNFHQLLLLQAKDDPNIFEWLKKKVRNTQIIIFKMKC